VKVKASRVLEIHNIILYTVSLETMQIYYVHYERRGPIAAASMRFVNNNNNNNNSYIRWLLFNRLREPVYIIIII